MVQNCYFQLSWLLKGKQGWSQQAPILSFFWRILQLISQLQKFETSVAKKYAAKVQRLQFARGPLMPLMPSSSSSPSMSMSGSFTPEFFRLERHRSRLRRRVGCSFGAIRNLQRLHQTLVHFCFLGPLCQKVFSLSLLHFVSVWLGQRWIHFLGLSRINAYFIRLQSIAHLSVM